MKTRILLSVYLVVISLYSSAQTVPYPGSINGGANSGIVGKIGDNLEVGPNGTLNYEIPIVAPSGTGGMTPQLSLVYNSTQNDGLLGSGFELSGLSNINRAPSNLHVDGVSGYVNFSSSDKFMLDGQRLIFYRQINSTSWEYKTENNNFAQIIASGGTLGSPASFTVKTKDGLTYEYSSNTAPLTRSATAGNTSIFWLLTKVSDTKTNYYTISYGKDDENGEYWPTRISYTGNENAQMLPYDSIAFDYTTSAYPQDSYVYGVKVRKSKIITAIKLYSGSTKVRYYEMDYKAVNYKRQLTQITEYAADGSKKNPTKFTWHNSSSFVASSVGYNPTSYIKKADLHVGDFNGDGKADFLATPKSGADWTGWRLFLSNGSSFSYHSSGSFSRPGKVQQIVVGDFNGDGYSDIVVKREYINYQSDLFLANVSDGIVNFVFERSVLSDSRDYTLRAAEFNGDGLMDIFAYFHKTKECKLVQSEREGYIIRPLSYTAQRFGTVDWDRVEMVDFNGDGLTDVLNLHADGYNLLTCDGYGTMSQTQTSTWPNKEHHSYFGDFNGDGKTDMLLTGWNKDPNSGGWGNWAVMQSTGDGNFVRHDFPKKFVSKDKTIFVADINGDGKDDFYAVDKTANGMSIVYFYINDGTGRYFSQTIGASTYPLDKWNYYWGDYNGDGKTDFLCTANFSKDTWTGYRPFLIPETANNLLAKITDGIGVETEISYKPMSSSDIHTRGTTRNYSVSSFSNSWYLVDKIQKTNGIGGKNITSFKYKNALKHRLGRGVIGFEYFIQKDETNNYETITQFEINTSQFVTAVKSVENKISGRTIHKTEYANSFNYYPGMNYKVFSFRPTHTRELKYEYNSGTLLSTTVSTCEYDDFGNVTVQKTTLGSDEITTTNVYTNDEANWFLGRLTESIVNKKNSAENITLTTKFEYDSISGLLNKEIFEPNDSMIGYTKTYTHDVFGNITESKTIPNNSAQDIHITKTQYDASGRFIINSTDNMNFVTSNTIDFDLGVVTSSVDPNNYITRYEYNKFGEQQITKTDIDYSQTVYRWANGHADSPANAVFFKYMERKGLAPVLEFYDCLGRVLRTVMIGFGSQKIYTDVVYNAKGQLEKTSEPYFAGGTVYWNQNEYDNAGRITKQKYADNSAYTFQYDGFTTTTTDQLRNKTIKTVNANGSLVESIDAKMGKVRYEYDVSGNCTKVIGPRTTIVSRYDKAGNKTRQEDPDLGIMTYVYNAYGEMVSRTASQKTIAYEYDGNGRVKKETSPDGTITYTYDTKWVGAVSKISSTNGTSEEYFYDQHGRLIKSTEVISGRVFTTSITYNSNRNLQETTTYPSNLKVKNEYDSHGHLVAVKNTQTGFAYWTANQKNARGQLESITYGNGLTTRITYNPQKGYISHILTENNIQNSSYAFNPIGNLVYRRNNIRGLTEYLNYDELSRLIAVSYNGVLKQEMQYDAAGNLTFKTGVGSQFVYQDNTNRLMSVTGEGYSPREWEEIRYTAHNKVSYIKSGNNSQAIVYGPSQQRKQTVTIINGTTETKYYSGSLYEEVIKNGETKQINYIFAGSESIAIFEKSTATGEKLLYLHKDHLGSVQVLTDAAGELVQELSYDAWGRRRDPSSGEYYTDTTEANAFTPRGFTGHEHLDMFDIVNMDGRMYDPMLGRFLSPDPYVQAPDFTQGLNRYIYCLNNPLSLYDPSGYSWFSKNWKSLVAATVGIVVTVATGGIGSGIGGAMIAGALGGASAGLTGALLNGANLGQIAKSTITGGFWGAIGGFFANASGGGHFLERLFKHSFSQGWLEGVKGGNALHGFIAGATSVVGGTAINKYGSKLGYAGKVAANAIVSGTASELGGGKFANGAITGAFSMMFNDMMHPPKVDFYKLRREKGDGAVIEEIFRQIEAFGPKNDGEGYGTFNFENVGLSDDVVITLKAVNVTLPTGEILTNVRVEVSPILMRGEKNIGYSPTENLRDTICGKNTGIYTYTSRPIYTNTTVLMSVRVMPSDVGKYQRFWSGKY